MHTPAGYSRLQIALHWIMALLILWRFLFNDAMTRAWGAIGEGLQPAFSPPILAHVLVGAAILIASIWRLCIEARRRSPAMVGDNGLLNRVAWLTHLALYGLMILMPISGALAWFGGVQAAADIRNVPKIALLALIVLHIIGALYHQFFLRDGVMDRMKRAQG